jgi:transposase
LTIPGVAELLGLTIASEIGDIARFPAARKLVGYAGLAPRINQSGESSRIGRISKAEPATLRWARRRGLPAGAATPSPTPPRPPSRARS